MALHVFSVLGESRVSFFPWFMEFFQVMRVGGIILKLSLDSPVTPHEIERLNEYLPSMNFDCNFTSI